MHWLNLVKPLREWAAVARGAAVAGCACLLAIAQPVQAQVVNSYTNSTDSAVNGVNDTATSCSAPLTRTFTVGSAFTVSDVNIAVLAAHTYRGDLVMNLVSPAGTRVQLTPGSGSNGADNFNATFDDEAAAPIANYTANATATATTIVPPYAASFRPSALLSAFDGQSALGTWTLEICDQYASDSGTFFQADLSLTTTPTNYADLSLAKTVSNAAPTSGSSVTYTITVANAASSPQTANSVVVRDLLPAGLSYVSDNGGGAYNSATGDWSVGALAPGQNRTLTITATVTATSGASIINTAEVTASSVSDLDSTPDNGASGEDDYASAALTITGTRVAGTPPVLSCPSGTLTFDWDSNAWSAGTTSNSYTFTGLGSVAFNLVNPGTFLNNATYGGQSPTRQNVVTGGYAVAQYSLFELVDLASASDLATTTIALGNAVSGLQFSIFDVDYSAGQFADRVIVTGSFNGAPVTPTLTNGISNYVIGNAAYGDALSSDTQANGNVVVTFTAPVDTVVISYGNHGLAPSNPGQQAVAIHDIVMCRPQANVSVTKVSTVLSDPVNGSTNPKMIPGAVVEYCILVSNLGSATIANVVATDALPANTTYVAGSGRSGASCATATIAEDDDNAGPDESDPYGLAIAGSTVTARASSLNAGSALAFKLNTTIN